MENIVMAATNYPAIYPIRRALRCKDYLTATSIMLVTLASFISHLVENHKHGMPGIGFSARVSYYLNRVDVLSCWIVIARFIYIYYKCYRFNFDIIYDRGLMVAICLLPILFLFISEYDKYNPKHKYRYMITHSIWHVGIFYAMYYFLDDIIYRFD